MERHEIIELMSTLKLFGMRAAYDEVMASGIKRRHEPQRIVGDLLRAEIAENRARSTTTSWVSPSSRCQGHRRVRLRGLAGQRGAGPRAARGRVSRRPAQRRADRRKRIVVRQRCWDHRWPAQSFPRSSPTHGLGPLVSCKPLSLFYLVGDEGFEPPTPSV